jgi:hypothetical protein
MLDKQLTRFINSGFKYTCFTKALYKMLYIETNMFIAHYDRHGFYTERFQIDALNTVLLLRQVDKPELKPLCDKLATALIPRIKMIRTELTQYSIN